MQRKRQRMQRKRQRLQNLPIHVVDAQPHCNVCQTIQLVVPIHQSVTRVKNVSVENVQQWEHVIRIMIVVTGKVVLTANALQNYHAKKMAIASQVLHASMVNAKVES